MGKVRHWGMRGAAVAGMVALVLTVSRATLPRDPLYKGKHLSEYLLPIQGASLRMGYQWSWTDPDEPTQISRPEADCVFLNPLAADALEHVGTNGLPMLVRMLKASEPWPQYCRRRLVTAWPALGRFVRVPPSVEFFERKIAAGAAFRVLGSKAAPAIPSLIRLLADPEHAPSALVALIAIGPRTEQQILSLTNCLRQYGPPRSGPWPSPDLLHRPAIFALSSFGSKAAGAIPILLQTLESTNEFVRGASAVALVRIGAPADAVVPVLVRQLPTNSAVMGFASLGGKIIDHGDYLQMALWSVGEYGRSSVSALPVLSNFMSQSGFSADVVARNAANKIRRDL